MMGISNLLALILFISCIDQRSAPEAKKTYRTENVIIVVIDGPRFSETWGNSTFKHIPLMANNMRTEGVLFQHFYNLGVTYTTPGHTAITTGVKQDLENTGREVPNSPSIFQLWLEKTKSDPSKAWVIASKGKLSVLANTNDPDYKDKHLPSFNCGNDGLGNGYRPDTLTFEVARTILETHKPNLVLINLLEPDVQGHSNNWPKYLKGITASDRYVWQLWNFIQQDSHYKDKTTLLITNDHGRHPDGHLDGFVSHGDGCENCRRISLLALGPDFKKGITVTDAYEQVDIPTTVAEILGFPIPNTQGRVFKEAFR